MVNYLTLLLDAVDIINELSQREGFVLSEAAQEKELRLRANLGEDENGLLKLADRLVINDDIAVEFTTLAGVDNPEFPFTGAFVEHKHTRTGEPCSVYIPFNTPEMREEFPDSPRWDVLSWGPLFLRPSIVCKNEGCNLHGWIEYGSWWEARFQKKEEDKRQEELLVPNTKVDGFVVETGEDEECYIALQGASYSKIFANRDQAEAALLKLMEQRNVDVPAWFVDAAQIYEPIVVDSEPAATSTLEASA